MKKVIILLTALILSGCTTYSAFEKGENEEEYYLITNTRILFIISIPAIDRCNVDENKIMTCESLGIPAKSN